MHDMKKILLIVLVLGIGGFVFFSNKPAKVVESPLSPVEQTRVIELSDGDTYDMTAGYVSKIIDGKEQRVMAYNRSIPGPTIRVKQGAQVTIRFTNNTKENTLLHSHGVRMENAFDGSQLTQKDILPGETFVYKLRYPDPGVFWYHPHVREDRQQPLGLYGNFIVEPTDADYWAPSDKDVALTLGDILMEDGEIAPFSDKFITHTIMGRFGNTLLVSGNASTTIQAKAGEVLRLYVTNVSTVRPYQFRIPGAQMKLVGADSGRVEKEMMVESIIITPSERYVLDVFIPKAGTYSMEHSYPGKTYTLGTIVATEKQAVSSAGNLFPVLRSVFGKIADEFKEARTFTDKVPDKTVRLTLKTDMSAIMQSMGGGNMDVNETIPHGHGATTTDAAETSGGMNMSGMTNMGGMNMDGMGMGSNGMTGGQMNMNNMASWDGIEWEDTMGPMNIFSTDKNTTWIMRDETDGKENMDIVWKFKLGDLVKVRVINDPNSAHPMFHPIHFHGNRFVVLSRNNIPTGNMMWKDTTFLKPGDQLDILLEASNPGKWMAHCHIAEHLHSGMMMEFDVES